MDGQLNKIEQTTDIVPEKVILVGVYSAKPEAIAESIKELEELVKTAGGEVVDVILQARDGVDSKTYVGKGKVEEISDSVFGQRADMVVVNDELSGVQLKNLDQALECRVIDRTALILDIFAKHAHTKEGILQVELAQLKYRSARLEGLGKSLSRLGGGIGTRGPGEKKLETDRRHIRARISQIKAELEDIANHRNLLRNNRKKLGKPIVAIAGYTNAGKSTLLNRLCDSQVLSYDKLFATLDPTTRAYVLPDGKEIFLTDTVGFIEKLPHNLVEAFASTLEEVVYSDLILHVVDCANPNFEQQMAVVYDTLTQLKAMAIPIITVFNKIDAVDFEVDLLRDPIAQNCVGISALTGQGVEQLVAMMEQQLRSGMQLIETVIPYDQGSLVQVIREYGQLLKEEFQQDGTYVKAYLEPALINKYKIKSK